MMDAPSGDQIGCQLPPSFVRGTSPVPSTLTTKTLVPPVRFGPQSQCITNASRDPSGDQEGLRANWSPSVNLRTPEPSAFIRKSQGTSFPPCSGQSLMNATRVPSGDTAGCPSPQA